MAVVANSDGNALRDIIKSGKFSEEQIQGDLTATIGKVMISYCGANSDGTHIGIFRDCAELMVHKFSEMSHGDIIEAFRLAATNEIEANIIAYKGAANVSIFGNVMSKYKEYRRKYEAELSNQKELAERERMQAEGYWQKKLQYEQMVVDWYEHSMQTKGSSIDGYGQIPVYYYNTLDELGKINVDIKTKQIYLQLAIEQYAEVLKMKESKEKSDRRFIADLMKDGFSEGLINVEKDKKLDVTNLAKRLLLYAIIKGDVVNKERGIIIEPKPNTQ